MRRVGLLLSFLLIVLHLLAQNQTGFQLVEKPDKKQVDVLYNGKLLTAYCYYDSIMKPFLFPINTLDGISVTRGYPIAPKAGERTDHPHHVGLWMNYESVNGLDFWNNSTAIPADRKDKYGTIKHDKIVTHKVNRDSAYLTVTANWVTPAGKILLNEKTTYTFFVKSNQFFIDRNSTLCASDETVTVKEVQYGL